MIAKLMGIGDIAGAVAIALLTISPALLPKQIVLYIAGYLILKGGFFAFTGNMVSMIDVLCGIYIILLYFGVSVTLLSIFAVVFLLQKNVAALLS
jgi:hypothetical protein